MSQSGDRNQAAAADPPLLHAVTGACRSAFVTVGAFSFCINLLVLTVPIYMVQLFDRVMTSRSEDTLLVLTLAAVAAFAVMAALDLIRSRMLVRIGLWLDGKLSPALFAATLGPTAAGAQRSTRCLRDLSQVRTFLTGAGVLTLLDAPWVPLFIALIFILHPVLGLAAVAGGGLMIGLAFLNEVLTRAPLRDANAAAFHGMTAAESMVRQAEAAEGMGMGKTLSKWWGAENARALRFQAVASDRAGLIMALSKFVRLALQVLILGLAALFVVRQELSVGAMIAASIVLTRALAPVEQSIGVWRSLVVARMAFRRVKDTLLGAAERSQMPLPRPSGKLVVSDLAFVPEGLHEPVFSGLSFRVNPGELLGVTGPTGAGKSTLVRMLLGVAKPTRGTVRLDGADVYAWNADDLGRHVGYVPQVVELLPGTIRDNISRFSEAPPEHVIEAANRAGIHELILRFAEGYDTVVGGPSDVLSVGTRQRVALARALFGDPSVVILDEPYSNLDGDGVTALIAAIQGLKARGATTVIVAHRPSILAHAKRVLLLQDGSGKIIMKGARTNLRVFTGADEPAGQPGPADTARSVA